MEKSKKIRKPKLEPVDLERCQCEETPAHSFMTFGPKPKTQRCDQKPVWVATENKPGEDGLMGSMSLCEAHRQSLIKKMGTDFATIVKIKEAVVGCTNCTRTADMLECIVALRGVVEEVLPQLGHIVLQDYGRLNESMMMSTKIIKEAGIPVK